MSNKRNHNTIYFLTTLSVYLGLVIVGASPQVLAQAEFSQNSQSRSFEISTETNNVFTKLKLKKQFQYQDVLPYVFVSSSTFNNRLWTSQTSVYNSANLHAEIVSINNQIFTTPILPRASI